MNNKSKILVYFSIGDCGEEIGLLPPFLLFLSFPSFLVCLPNYLKEMNASPVFQHDIAMRWHLA